MVPFLARLGYDSIAGKLSGGMLSWHKAGEETVSHGTVTVQELCSILDSGGAGVSPRRAEPGGVGEGRSHRERPPHSRHAVAAAFSRGPEGQARLYLLRFRTPLGDRREPPRTGGLERCEGGARRLHRVELLCLPFAKTDQVSKSPPAPHKRGRKKA